MAVNHRIYCPLGCKAGPTGNKNPCLMQKESFEEAWEWLANHINRSSAPRHGISRDEAEECILAHPKFIVAVDANGDPVDGDDAWPQYASRDEDDEDLDGDGDGGDDADGDGSRPRAKAKAKGKGKPGKGKGKGKGGWNDGGKGLSSPVSFAFIF